MNILDKLKQKLIKMGSAEGAEEKVTKNFWTYFKKHKKDITFTEEVEKIYDLLTSGNLNKTDKALLVGALLFFLNPFNILLDFIPFIGLIDNMVVIALVYRYLTNRALEENAKKSQKDDSN